MVDSITEREFEFRATITTKRSMDCAVDQMTLGLETTNHQQIIISNGKNWHQLQKETSFTFC